MVTNLKPFKLYEFDVKAHTDSDEGPYSRAVQCSTLEGRKFCTSAKTLVSILDECERKLAFSILFTRDFLY